MLHLLSRLIARLGRAPVAEAVPAYYVPERGQRGSARKLTALEQMYGYFGDL
mgnify:FL=1|jgi:hypothetical protein